MCDDNLSEFEIINKKPEGSESGKNDTKNTSLVTGLVPPPSALPTFVTSNSSETSSSNMFHTTEFSPEIPNVDHESAEPDVRGEEYEDPLGAIENSLYSWMNKGSNFLNKVAEKAKSSVGTVITTLDPQMKDFLSSSSTEYELIVTSAKEVEVSAIREAFQDVFNNITVRGLEVDHSNFAKQIVGFESAAKAVITQIESICNQHPIKGPILAVQNFIVEVSEEKWYDLDLIVLHDLEKGSHLETYSQMIPVPYPVINMAKEDTPKEYEHISGGYSVAVSQIMGSNLQVHPSEWQETLTGVSRRQRICSAARVVSNLYKNML